MKMRQDNSGLRSDTANDNSTQPAKSDPNRITEHFTWSEFACKDGTPVPEKYRPNGVILAQNLEALREYMGIPIVLNSVYRTPSYNKQVGGTEDSQHKLCKAGDIRATKEWTPKKIAKAIEHLITIGKMKDGGIGIYPTFVHYDIRDKRARW